MVVSSAPRSPSSRAGETDRQFAIACALAALAVLLTAGLLISAVTRYVRKGDGVGGDFLTDYAGGYIVRTGQGHLLYDLPTQERIQHEVSPGGANDDVNPFVLPPAAAWLFSPMSALPYRAAHVLFTAANLLGLAGVLWLLRDQLRDVRQRLRVVFLATFALSMPAVTDISWGQIDLLLVGAALLGWRCLHAGKDVSAGLAFSLALMKPHFLAGVVVLLLLQRRWKTLATLGAAAIAVLAVPAMAMSPDALADYGRLVTGVAHMPAYIDTQPQVMANWRGVMASVTGRDEIAIWLPGAIVVAALATAGAVRTWRRDPGSPRSYALAVTLPLLVSPHVHMQSMMLLFVAVAWLLRTGIHGLSVRGWKVTGETALLYMLVALFVGWFVTANGLAFMVLITGAVFSWCALAPLPDAESGEGTWPSTLAA